jgi:3-phosphoshikimate 1-carboxyvinyltransferase
MKMDIRISPSRISGTITAISSKSDAHRNLICAALADAPTVIKINSLSEDIKATIDCITALGAKVVIDDAGKVIVSPIPTQSAASIKHTENHSRSLNDSGDSTSPRLYCKESGSTLRFLLPVASTLYSKVLFEGSGRLPDRPLSPLLEEMEAHGCQFSAYRIPFFATGPLRGGVFSLPGDISSQFISGLLMAFPLTGADCKIVLTTPLESAGYIDMTIDTMQCFGVTVQRQENGFFVPGGQQYRSPGVVTIDGDWSNSAFWLTAGALSGPIFCSGLSASSLQGDKQILSILRQMGANIYVAQNDDIVSMQNDTSTLIANRIDASQVPDLVPILAVAAATAEGETVIYNAARLRIKESDRLHAICDCINRIGGKAEQLQDSLRISGVKRLSGGTVDSYNDHRIVMAMAIASTVCSGDIVIKGAEAVNKSYPDFLRDFEKLGGNAYVINHRQ